MEIDRISAVLAHELRNPLAGILTHLACLREMFDRDDPRLESIDWIDREAERMSRTLTAVLDFARGAKPALVDLALAPFLSQLAARASAEARSRGIAFHLDLPGEHLAARADPVLLERILENLLDNAFKAVASPGGDVRLAAVKEGGSLRITCRDNGRGVPADRREEIFEPFFTDSASGAGLGLYLARRIARDHGGSLWVESVVGRGTTFVLELAPARGGARPEKGKRHAAACR